MFLSFLGWYWEGSSDGPIPPDPPGDSGARPTGGWERDALVRWLMEPRQEAVRQRIAADKSAKVVTQIAEAEGLDASVEQIVAAYDELNEIRRKRAIAALLLGAV